jgi:hypothetical protein
MQKARNPKNAGIRRKTAATGGKAFLSVEADEKRITPQQRQLNRARSRALEYLKPGTSLSGELLAERRRAAKTE